VLIFAAFLTENVLDDDGDWSAKDWLIFLLIDCASRLAVTCVLFAK
jgi:hypothetical protein